ncbi:MAG TPA: O-antigen ligase family protein [Solirubrobacteraceae bacterium]|nr:O-antigen ligase family protein [Solirubrobacteraceae bacterium]
MTSKLTAPLRQAPVTLPALVALALFVVWATDEAGYPVSHWAPGGVIVLALLAIAIAFVGLPWAHVPIAVKLALGCLAAYTALSFLSILWAAVPGAAWEGADRTLLYLLVFWLFACWPQQGSSALLLLGAWTLAMVGLALFVALHLDASSSARLPTLIPGARLTYPSGYPNASAAQWLMAFWPAFMLARSQRLGWWLRGLLAGGCVLLAEIALLSQSRGSLYATPVMLVLVFTLAPMRTRTFALLVPVVAGIAAAAPAVLRVGDHVHDGQVIPATLHHAIAATLLAAVVVGAVVALAAAIESRATLSEPQSTRVHRGVAATGLAALVIGLAAGGAALGNPVPRLEHAWHTFKGGYAADTSGSRLISGLGSNRYDFYRVALDQLDAHPLLGIGVDNFQEQYLRHGRSQETPRYPHSVELRVLVETGLVGALLALVGLAAALWAAMRAVRRTDPLAASVAVAALAGFAYWAVHGSFDWFWEFAGLGAPAFALLGLACALAPRRAPQDTPDPRAATPAPADVTPDTADATPSASVRRGGRTPAARRVPSVAVRAGALALALAAVASLVAPWLSQLELESAVRVWTYAPQVAYARLDDAARLNPLSDEAELVAGTIALRYRQLARADRDFAQALERSHDDAYATLERGAIASASGRRSAALGLLERALELSPREVLAREALRVVREGRRVNLVELNRAILLKARELA